MPTPRGNHGVNFSIPSHSRIFRSHHSNPVALVSTPWCPFFSFMPLEGSLKRLVARTIMLLMADDIGGLIEEIDMREVR